MAKITQINDDKYLIKYIPEGYRQLYKNPYRSITINGKEKAYIIYNDASLIEETPRARIHGPTEPTVGPGRGLDRRSTQDMAVDAG